MLLLGFLLLPVALAVADPDQHDSSKITRPKICIDNGHLKSWKESEKFNSFGVNCYEVIGNLNELVVLDLQAKNITDIEKSALETLPISGLLSLGLNNLTNTDFLDSLPDVQSVSLSSANITKISPGNFSKFKSFRNLYVKGNLIKELKAHTLNNFSSLMVLDLGNNRELTRIEPGFFHDLTSLVYLYVDNCNIANLEEGVFSGLQNIRVIYFQHNRLTEIVSGVFTELPPNNRIMLSLTNNDIKTIRAGAFNNSGIVELYLSNNNVSNIENGSFDLPSLKLLYLTNNSMTELGIKVFDKMKVLELLDLSDNFIKKIGNGTFLLPNLKTLNLNNNHLTTQDHPIFSGMDSLETLFLNNNKMQLIKNKTMILPSLKKLELRSSTLTRLEIDTEQLKNLEFIDLKDNWMHRITIGPTVFYLRTGYRSYEEDLKNNL